MKVRAEISAESGALQGSPGLWLNGGIYVKSFKKKAFKNRGILVREAFPSSYMKASDQTHLRKKGKMWEIPVWTK